MSWLNNKFILIPSILVSGVGGLAMVKDYYSGDLCDKQLKANDKTFIVTGANTGIGRATVRELAKRGGKVYMACRNMKKCEEARKEMVIETNNRYIYCRPCDLSSQKSIKNFVKVFKEEQESLHVLINNAGVMRCPKSTTDDGIEMQMGVNHMGHFLLTNLLLDYLKKSAPSRIINLTSSTHAQGKINKDDFNMEKEYDPTEAYNRSKLANMLFTVDLSIRLLETKVTVNAINPGITDSDITRHMPTMKGISSYFTYMCMWPFIKKPGSAAQSIVHAALDPALDEVTGQYLSDMKVDTIAPNAINIELGRWLWDVSTKWTKLDESLKQLQEQLDDTKNNQ